MNLLSKYAQVHAGPAKASAESDTVALNLKTAFISAAKLKAASIHVLSALDARRVSSNKSFVIFSIICALQVGTVGDSVGMLFACMKRAVAN